MPELLSESIVSSFQSLIVIGGYIVLFMILTDAAKTCLRRFPDRMDLREIF